jgi:hypothetical protein
LGGSTIDCSTGEEGKVKRVRIRIRECDGKVNKGMIIRKRKKGTQ